MRHTRWTHALAIPGAAVLGLLCTAGSGQAGEEKRDSFTLAQDEHGMTLKTPDGRVVFTYMTRKPAQSNLTANSVCCLFPVNTPSGVRAVDFAPGDHRHHRGVFLAWHAAQCGAERADFWGWGEMAPTKDRVIKNRSVKLTAADAEHAAIEVANDWTIAGQTVVEEALTLSARQRDKAFVIDLDFRLAPKVEFKLDQTAFGGFCAKCRQDGQSDYFGPQGKVDLPAPHHLKPETDWPASPWYDYVVELKEGKTIGVAVVDHPANPKSTWHNLKAIAMVNPCIAAPGPVTVKQGETLRLRYRLVVHDGPAPTDLLNGLAAEWRK